MSPTRDQRALLELILRRGHSYEDIAALIEVSPEEARARAHEALAALAGADPDARAELSDFLLGQLDPAATDEVMAVLERDPDALDLASELSAKLSLLVPGAQLPALPRAAGGVPTAQAVPTKPARPGPAPPQPAEPSATATGGRSMWSDPRVRTIAAALAVAVVAVVLAIALGGGEDDDGPESAQTTTTATPAAQTPPPQLFDLEPSPAAPEGASGRIGIGQIEDRFALQYFAEGLEPTQGTQRYVVWLYNGPEAAVPVTVGRRVGSNGTLNGLAELAPRVVQVLPQTRFVDISLEPAPQERGSFAYRGESILRARLAAAEPAQGGGEGGGDGQGGGQADGSN